MKKLLLFSLIAVMFTISSCADSKVLELNGQRKEFQPYGWADYEELKNDSIQYKTNIGNIVLDVIFCQTIVVPVWLTGWQLYEPVKVKDLYVQQPKIDSTLNTFIYSK